MSLNDAPSSERVHIGFFGCTNSGKSSLVNALTNQSVAVVSDVRGTTTDVIRKSMEILPIGPCVIVDTAGFDDDTPLGKERIKNTKKAMDEVHAAVLVRDASVEGKEEDREVRVRGDVTREGELGRRGPTVRRLQELKKQGTRPAEILISRL